MKRLIINADDFGLGPLTNAAILRCLEQGVVTSATCLVNGPAAEAALEAIRSGHPGRFGLHANLVHFGALTGDSPLAPGGRLGGLARVAWLQAVSPGVLYACARRELQAQLDAFRHGARRDPTHLDTHLWSQMFPSVFRALADVAAGAGVRVLRNVRVTTTVREVAALWRLAPSGQHIGLVYQTAKAALLRSSAALFRYRSRWEARGGCMPDAYFGVVEGLLYGNVTTRLKALERIMQSAPAEGVSELMVHPGGPDRVDLYGFHPEHATVETEALLSPGFRNLLDRWQIHLVGPDASGSRAL
jgi:predicted glycoside hydrolase/deacetylase ChbG (UPF0249 family)